MVNNVKHYREAKGLTQEALAKLADVSRQTIISIEKGYYIPTTVLALKLQSILKVKFEELFVLEKSDWT